MGDNDPDVARIAALETMQVVILAEVQKARSDLGEMKTKLDNATGGLRMLMIVGGLVGSAVGLWHAVLHTIAALNGTAR